MLRCALLLGLALCGMAHAHIELTATPAWKGWTRPGRTTELEVRLSSDVATRAVLDLVAGRQSVHAELELQPGRAQRLHIPASAAERLTLSVALPQGPPQRRDIDMAQSESPLLGVGLASGEPVHLQGFHTLALAADDLPRNASAYTSIDALILDAPTLGALDQRQLGALLAHAAACGRIVLLNTDPGVRRVLDGAGGCGGRALMSAVSLADARSQLESSLAASLPAAISPEGIGGLAQTGHAVWNRVALLVAVYFAVAVVALMFLPSLPVMLLIPALACAAIVALLHGMQPASQLVVWSEGESGAQSARYQAWQQFAGYVRERTRVPIPPQLASSVQSCEPNGAMRFDFDAKGAQASFAEFDARLFRTVSLCYSGSFPMARSLAVESRKAGVRELRNTGTKAWPTGTLLAAGLAHDLPALGPGEHTVIDMQAGKPAQATVLRTAMARSRGDGMAALWQLDLGGVVDAPVESKGWLLVSTPSP